MMIADLRPGRGARAPRRVVPPELNPKSASWHGVLHLSSSGWCLPVDDVRAEPDLTALVSADACWLLAYQDWARRRPQRWRGRAWRAWRKEEAALAVEQDGLVRASFAVPTLRSPSSP
jgi:hypothetical protein